LAKELNITQYGFNDYLNSGKYESLITKLKDVNPNLEFKRMMRQMDQDQKQAEEELEEGSKKAEEMQAKMAQLSRDDANKRTDESDGADYAVAGDAAAIQMRD
jgi:Ulp1 family protease